MSDALKNTQRDLIQTPWMQDANARAFNETLGSEKDRLVDLYRSGVKMRWPTAAGMQSVAASVGASLDTAEGDPTRLRRIGTTLDLERLGGMSDAQYNAYLESTWQVHGEAGTEQGIVDALHTYGVPDVELVEEWQGMAGTWANPGGYGHRVCLILGPNYGTFGWTPQSLPLPLPTPVLGIAGMTAAQLVDLARIIRRWKDAGCCPVKLVFRFKVGGITSPVFGVTGVPFPIPLSSGPDSVTFYMTAHYFNEAVDGAGNLEGVPLPLQFGPVYTLDDS